MLRKRRVRQKREVSLFKPVIDKRLYWNETHDASFSAAHVIAKLKGYVRTVQVTPLDKSRIISQLNCYINIAQTLYRIKFQDFHLPAYFWDKEKRIVKPVTMTSSTSQSTIPSLPPSDGDTISFSDMEIELSHIANEAVPIAQSDKEKITSSDYDEAFFDHVGIIVETILNSSNLPRLPENIWNSWVKVRPVIISTIFLNIRVPIIVGNTWILEAEETEPTTYEIFCNRFEQRQPPE